MKQFRYFLFLIAIILTGQNLWGQNRLQRYEYWFNSDFNSKIAQVVTPENTLEFSASLDVSSLPDGVNMLHIRYQDEMGFYSVPLNRLFVKVPPTPSGGNTLLRYEYWYNSDFASRQIHEITPNATVELATSLDISTLPDGVNILHMRFQDERGYYSTPLNKMFVKVPPTPSGGNTLVRYEYWYNSDFANRQMNEITPNATVELATSLDVSELPDGVNILHMRFQDERGYYSTPLNKMFVKIPPTPSGDNTLVRYEYWYNSDFTNRQIQEINPATTTELTTVLDVSELPEGVNKLHLRYLDERGYYSSIVSKIFFKKTNTNTENALTAYKYWIDDAFDQAVLIEISPAETIHLLEADLALDTMLPGGTHTISIQYRDVKNTWSVPLISPFTKDYDPRADLLVDNNPACSGINIEFTAENLIDTDVITWNFGDGTPTSTLQNPTHTYMEADTYTVTVTLEHTGSGTIHTQTMSITVNPSYNSAEYYINDGFENTDVGSLPDNWVIRYNGTGTANQKVVDNPVKNGIRSFQLEGATNWASQIDHVLTDLPDHYTVEAWVQAEKILSGGTGGFMLFNPANSWGSDIIRVDFYNGYITVHNRLGTTFGPRYVLQPYQTGEWYHIRVVTNFNTYTCKIFINGEQASGTSSTETLDEFPMLTTLLPTHLTLVAGNSGTTKMFFDDVKLYSEHNPQPPIDLAICANEVPYVFGNQSLTQSGTYYENFYTEHGCDSIVQLNLTIKPLVEKPILDTQDMTVCPDSNGSFTITNYNPDYTYQVNPPDGVSQIDAGITAPIGTYTVTAVYDNCHSESSESVTISAHPIDNTVVFQDYPLLLTANQTEATYQWIDCSNGNTPIDGATGISFEPLANGSYAVQITKNGCTVLSDCITISTIDVADFYFKQRVNLYPNPAREVLYMLTDLEVMVEIYTINGHKIATYDRFTGQNQIGINHLSSGVYLVKVIAMDGEWKDKYAIYKMIKTN